jgi:hypothetical protein
MMSSHSLKAVVSINQVVSAGEVSVLRGQTTPFCIPTENIPRENTYEQRKDAIFSVALKRIRARGIAPFMDALAPSLVIVENETFSSKERPEMRPRFSSRDDWAFLALGGSPSAGRSLLSGSSGTLRQRA